MVSSAARLLAPLIALVIMTGIFAVLQPRFLTPESAFRIGEQAAIIVIVGIGQTLVIIAGGIDLSVGSVVAFSGTFAAVMMLRWGIPIPVAVLCGILWGGVIGLFNGLLTVKTKLHPFIITLGAMMIFRGLAKYWTDAQNTTRLPALFTGLATGKFPLGPGKELVIPFILVWYIVIVAVAVHLFLTRTQAGRYCFAIGSNPQSARLSGVNVDFWVTTYFILAGLLFGFGGIIQAARTGIGEPTGAAGMELDAVAAAVIGGASLSGGQGSVGGTVLGAVLMATLRHGLAMLNLAPYWQEVALGSAIIVAVIYDRASRRRTDK